MSYRDIDNPSYNDTNLGDPRETPDEKEIDRLTLALVVAREEARVMRLRYERAVQALMRIHSFVLPPDLLSPDGKVFEFKNAALEHEMLRRLTAEIRSIPEALAAAGYKPAPK